MKAPVTRPAEGETIMSERNSIVLAFCNGVAVGVIIGGGWVLACCAIAILTG